MTTRKTACVMFAATAISLSMNNPVQAQQTESFNPAQAFCERQTFELQSLEEVDPWLDYVSGLRTGRSAAPDVDCPSSTVQAILNILSGPSIEAAEDKRTAFHFFYVSNAMEPQSTQRAIDRDGSFRYRNDVTLASFVWLLCPGTGEQRYGCVREIVGELPTEFVETSPVFCDFASGGHARVERVPGRTGLPLECAEDGAGADHWIRQTATILGE